MMKFIKHKTTMKTSEKIAIMQAYEEGKQIQYKAFCWDGWKDFAPVTPTNEPVWDWKTYDYRIKLEPKKPTYRPYKDFAEFRKNWEKHGGWTKNNDTGTYTNFNWFSKSDAEFICEKYVWADDDTPCGVAVEEGGEA